MEFVEWPKTPRLFRDCVITEKIDGTNACVVIEPLSDFYADFIDDTGDLPPNTIDYVSCNGESYLVGAQSRKRLITPESDNFGFAKWVQKNSVELVELLGEGRHYGEWWGSGIQRGYGLPKGEKRFSLFNTHRWEGDDRFEEVDVPGLEIVPILEYDVFSDDLVHDALLKLSEQGSWAAPGFQNPEGVVVFHRAAGQTFKVLLENDDISKTESEK